MKQLDDKSWIFLGFDGVFTFSCNSPRYFIMHTDSSFIPIKAVNLISGLNSRQRINLELYANNNFLFSASHLYGPFYQDGLSFSVIRTDTSFSGICDVGDIPVINVAKDSIYTTHSTYSYTSDTITLKIDSLILPVQDFPLIQGGCSDFLAVSKIEYDKNGIEVYPNPADKTLVIRHWSLGKTSTGSVTATLEVYDVLGEKVFQSEIINQESEFDVSGWARGVYLLTVRTEEGIITKRVVKM